LVGISCWEEEYGCGGVLWRVYGGEGE